MYDNVLVHNKVHRILNYLHSIVFKYLINTGLNLTFEEPWRGFPRKHFVSNVLDRGTGAWNVKSWGYLSRIMNHTNRMTLDYNQ